MNIVLSIDETDHSDAAVKEVRQCNWPAGSRIDVVTVVDKMFGGALDKVRQESGKRLVDSVAAKLQEFLTGHTIRKFVLQGTPKAEVHAHCEREKADLLIVGSRGHKGLTRIVLGSVSHALLMSIPCSMRIARKTGELERPCKRVLVSLDSSRYSKLVVKRLQEFSWQKGTKFLCVTAIPSMSQLIQEANNAFETDVLQAHQNKQREAAEQHLMDVVNDLERSLPDCQASFEIIQGDPREAVVQKAKDWEADLVMTGCRGKDWINRMVIGSVSEAIATWADCSVEVVKV